MEMRDDSPQHLEGQEGVLEQVVALATEHEEPVSDLLIESARSKRLQQALHAPLKEVRLPRVACRGDDGDCDVAAHDIDDCVDHMVVLLHVAAICVERAVGVECDEAQMLH